eukprot:s473_g20.t1
MPKKAAIEISLRIRISLGNGCRGISGKTVESGKVCRTVCKPGYTPSVDRLDCLAEVLTPSTFTCEPDPNGVTTIESSQKCTTQCKEGYHPSDATLSCFAGALTPATWSCLEDMAVSLDPCTPPTKIANAPELTCRQGNSIVSGTGCTTTLGATFS